MTLPPSLHERIFAAVRRIPSGKVATYGQVALGAGLPSQARLVGYALHRLPAESSVPWHRVVNARGGISLDERFGAGELQRVLLEVEGVRFNGEGKIDLGTYGQKS